MFLRRYQEFLRMLKQKRNLIVGKFFQLDTSTFDTRNFKKKENNI